MASDAVDRTRSMDRNTCMVDGIRSGIPRSEAKSPKASSMRGAPWHYSAKRDMGASGAKRHSPAKAAASEPSLYIKWRGEFSAPA